MAAPIVAPDSPGTSGAGQRGARQTEAGHWGRGFARLRARLAPSGGSGSSVLPLAPTVGSRSAVGVRVGAIVGTIGLLLSVSAAAWYLMSAAQRNLIQEQALDLAEIVARQATAARSVYAEHVVGKLAGEGFGANRDYRESAGMVPLPAQFMRLIGARASEESGDLYRIRSVSRWHLGAGQGLGDDFQRWAWGRLEAQDSSTTSTPVQWRPVWRIEVVDGIRSLRYMRADPALSYACVDCHNRLELQPETAVVRAREGSPTGKVWRLNELMGAIEVTVPIAKVEARAGEENRIAWMALAAMLATGMGAIGFLVFVDFARARRLTAEFAFQASHDSLTGLANRSEFERIVDAALRTAKAGGGIHSMMFLDLDQFKIVNDTCGHQAGDELLRQVTAVLHSRLRTGDRLARLGGDEFGVLLGNCAVDDARVIAETLCESLREFRFAWDDKVFDVAVSIGLVPIDENSRSVAELMSAADVACYAAKEGGRNRVHLFSTDDDELAQRRGDMAWAAEIGRAIDSGRMRLAMQAALPVAAGKPLARYQELLLRMFDERGRPVPTAALISAGERYGLMASRIDRWVVHEAFRLIACGSLDVGPGCVVAINLSGSSIGDRGFLAYVIEALQRSGISPRAICFEITESAAVRHFGRAGEFIQALRALGCRFALDDFGSGLSSFGYLKNLPIDFLKIDGAFVRDIASDPLDRALVESVVRIGKVLGIPTIAEWVENPAIFEQIEAIGVDYAQGFLFGEAQLLDVAAEQPGGART